MYQPLLLVELHLRRNSRQRQKSLCVGGMLRMRPKRRGARRCSIREQFQNGWLLCIWSGMRPFCSVGNASAPLCPRVGISRQSAVFQIHHDGRRSPSMRGAATIHAFPFVPIVIILWRIAVDAFLNHHPNKKSADYFCCYNKQQAQRSSSRHLLVGRPDNESDGVDSSCLQAATDNITTITTTTIPTSSSRSRPKKYVTWNRMIRRLQKFYNITGHCQPSQSDDPELHRWIQNIRKNYGHQVKTTTTTTTTRKRYNLSKDKLRLLNNMGFVWDKQEAAWNQHYQELCQFHARHGHCRVKSSTDNRRLWVWTRNLRRDYKQNGATFTTADRLAKLNAIDFWDSIRTHQEIWDERIAELQDFRSLHGHVDVPQDYSDNPSLGQWVMNVRTDYKRYLSGEPTGLTRARIAELEKLDFRWNVKEYSWFRMFEQVRMHVEKDCDNSTQSISNLELKLWLTMQRHQYQRKMQNRTSLLNPQRIEALESLPNFTWNGRSSSSSRRKGPTTEDWAKLFEGIREKGIRPGMRPKSHWFEGTNPFQEELKDTWTEEELLALWNQEDDNNDDEEE